MKPITLSEIAKSCGGVLHADGSIQVTSIATDSRKVTQGTLFAAIKGERVDGHSFIKQCIDSGAVCVLCEDAPQFECNYIQVESTLTALKGIAEYYRSLFSVPFIGITGSVGKTSTKEMIYAVLSQKFKVHKTQGNFNNELGVPLTIFGLDDTHEVSVIEMGISDFGEMTRLSKIVRPDISVITNIGCCHLENLVDRDGVLKAKIEMLDYLSDDGKIFLCGDDDKLFTIKEHNGIKPVFFGFNPHNDYTAEIISSDPFGGIQCRMNCKGNSFDVTVPAVGNHMVSNALCAAAIGEALGMSTDEIKRGVECYKTVGSRSNIIKKSTITVIDDCYNANPTSMRASVDTLAQFESRRVALVGDMKELGVNEVELHYDTGRYIADKGVECIIAVGSLAKHIFDGASCKGYYYQTVDECIDNLKNIINNGDTVLVKASHSMHFERLVDTLKNEFE